MCAIEGLVWVYVSVSLSVSALPLKPFRFEGSPAVGFKRGDSMVGGMTPGITV